MTREHLRRLKRLRKLMQKLSDEDKTLDMTQYANECGSPSCVLGWATTIIPELEFVEMNDVWAGLRVVVNTKSGSRGTPAGQEAFGLSDRNASILFGMGQYFNDGSYLRCTEPFKIVDFLNELIDAHEPE